MRNHSVAILLLTLSLHSSLALAEPNGNSQELSEYQEALAALQAHDETKAYDILTVLWSKRQTHDVAATLGKVELSKGMYRDAAEHLAFGIRNLPADEAASAKPALAAELEKAKAQVATLTVTVDPADAEIAVDGQVQGKSPMAFELFAEPGRHVVQVTHPTMGTAEQAIDVKAGETRTIDLKLAKAVEVAPSPPVAKVAPRPGPVAPGDPAAKQAKQPAPRSLPADPDPEIETKTLVLIAGGTVTLVTATIGTIFAVEGHAAKTEATTLLTEAKQRLGSYPCPGRTRDEMDTCTTIAGDLDDRNLYNHIANWSLAFGGVAAVGTLATLIFWPSSHKATSTVVSPMAARGSGGMTLSGTF